MDPRKPIALAALVTALASAQTGPRVFLFSNASRDLSEFRAFAKVAARLKPYGRVQINIGVLADKSWHEVPRDRKSVV